MMSRRWNRNPWIVSLFGLLLVIGLSTVAAVAQEHPEHPEKKAEHPEKKAKPEHPDQPPLDSLQHDSLSHLYREAIEGHPVDIAEQLLGLDAGRFPRESLRFQLRGTFFEMKADLLVDLVAELRGALPATQAS